MIILSFLKDLEIQKEQGATGSGEKWAQKNPAEQSSTGHTGIYFLLCDT
jgi:hypothetical protein